MRIAYFTESLYPHVDGVSRTLAQLFGTLERCGVDFTIYAPFVPGEEVSWSHRVRRVRWLPFPLYPDYRVSLPAGHGIGPELDEYQADLIHVTSPTPLAAWATRYAADRGIPAVASFHTHFVSYFRYYRTLRLPVLERLGWRLMRRFYGRVDRVYVPSRALIVELAEHGIRNTELWSRGIDLERFSPVERDPALRARAGADAEHPMLLMVSRLVREKDLADLVAMNRLLRDRGARYRLALVGDGPMRGELERKLPDAFFAGHQSGEALARWYASADVFVFPSTTETFGNVVLEALASGVPAVVVDRGGPRDQVEEGVNGAIVPPNDPPAFAAAVERLLRQPALREEMGSAARARAERRDWEAINRRLLESYRRVVDAGRRDERDRTGAE